MVEQDFVIRYTCRAVWHHASGTREETATEAGRNQPPEAAERRRRRLRVKSFAVLSALIELSI